MKIEICNFYHEFEEDSDLGLYELIHFYESDKELYLDIDIPSKVTKQVDIFKECVL